MYRLKFITIGCLGSRYYVVQRRGFLGFWRTFTRPLRLEEAHALVRELQEWEGVPIAAENVGPKSRTS